MLWYMYLFVSSNINIYIKTFARVCYHGDSKRVTEVNVIGNIVLNAVTNGSINQDDRSVVKMCYHSDIVLVVNREAVLMSCGHWQ